jgi:hypothetical protein
MIYVPNCNLLQHNYNKMTLSIFRSKRLSVGLRMNWSNNLSKKLRNSYNAMKRLLRGINI